MLDESIEMVQYRGRVHSVAVARLKMAKPVKLS